MVQLFKLACLVGFKTWKSIICEDLAVFANALVILKKKNKHPAHNKCCALFQISALPVGNQSN